MSNMRLFIVLLIILAGMLVFWAVRQNVSDQGTQTVGSQVVPDNHEAINNTKAMQGHVGEYYIAMKDKLSASVEGLASYEDLMNGPVDLVPLISSDEAQQRAALNKLLELDRYGNQLLPYLGYVISDLDNWLANSAFNYLLEKAQKVAFDANRGIPPSVDESAWRDSVQSKRWGVKIDFGSYVPLESILYYVMSDSPEVRNRESAAKILIDAYGGSKRLEEALIKQFEVNANKYQRDELFALLARMSLSDDYKDGFKSDETMHVVVSEFRRDGAVRTLQPVAYLIGKYKPPEALQVLKTIITEHDPSDIQYYYALTTLQKYGTNAYEFSPLLQGALDKNGGAGKYADVIKATLDIISGDEK